MGLSATVPQERREVLAAPCGVPDPASPYRTVELPGDVEVTPDDHRFARQVGRDYGGTDFSSPGG
jgi:hypothetical protein